MRFLQCILYNNDCYEADMRIKPTRIVVHSTGVPNTALSRCVQPATYQKTGMGGLTRDEMMKLLGENKYNNHWNRGNFKKCVHAFIGKLADGSVATVQTLPWNLRGWGVGKGRKGSFNDLSIQLEMMEDDHSSKSYCKAVYNEAVEFCAMICEKYNIPVENIISHKEAYQLGYGSNHGDPHHWWSKFGYTMDDFRKAVEEKLNGSTLPYMVKVKVDCLNIRKGPGTAYDKVGSITDKGVYTIVEVQGNWGLLKSKKGYIHLGYTEKYKS
jgi:hypothetical protein